ncbi:MAG: glycosyltransferase [Verrucomicrobia bacterium]|nr:glycosyltransferase [Verrucomicrobiota bacterium]
MDLTVVIPAYNEEAIIEETLRDLERKLTIPHQVLVVNDHSHDRTAEIVERLGKEFPHVRLVHNTGVRGISQTLLTGWRAATTPVVVTMMADLCDDPLTVPAMLKKIEEGYDVCCGSRYMEGGGKIGGPGPQSWLSRFVGWSLHRLIGLPTLDASNAFKMYRRDVLMNMTIEEAGFASSLEIIVKAFLKNCKIAEVPTVWRARTKGKSSFKVFKVARNYARWYVWALLFRKHRF